MRAAVGVPADQIEAADLDLARRNVDRLAVAGQIVGALAGDLDGRELRRRLHDDAGIFRQQRADRRLRPGAGRNVFVTGPSRSSVERSSPQATVKR